jgi:hypothetical protein
MRSPGVDGGSCRREVSGLQGEGENGGAGKRRVSPSSPSGWLRYASAILAAQSRTHSVRYDGVCSDFRTADSRETALSIKLILEKSCNGTAELLVRHYVLEESFWSMTEHEQFLFRRGARDFRKALVAAGLIDPDPKDGEEGDRGL